MIDRHGQCGCNQRGTDAGGEISSERHDGSFVMRAPAPLTISVIRGPLNAAGDATSGNATSGNASSGNATYCAAGSHAQRQINTGRTIAADPAAIKPVTR
jgi:hypothetical protein